LGGARILVVDSLTKVVADITKQDRQVARLAAEQREIAERIARLEQPGR
jgi:cell division protein FtsB